MGAAILFSSARPGGGCPPPPGRARADRQVSSETHEGPLTGGTRYSKCVAFRLG